MSQNHSILSLGKFTVLILLVDGSVSILVCVSTDPVHSESQYKMADIDSDTLRLHQNMSLHSDMETTNTRQSPPDRPLRGNPSYSDTYKYMDF